MNNIVQPVQEKIQISPNEVSLQFLLSKDVGYTYSVEFLINISSMKRLSDPSNNLRPKDIDQSSLKKSIMMNIPSYDRKYMDLVSFDHTKAIFHLNVNKWFKDATQGLRATKKLASFQMLFSLKQAPPRMILIDVLRDAWSKFVTRKIKQWFSESDRRQKKFLLSIFPRSIRRKLDKIIMNMFDWEYNIRLNKVVATLQSRWIIALLYATNYLTKKESLSKISSKSKKELFNVKIKRELSYDSFNKKKWKELLNKKFF